MVCIANGRTHGNILCMKFGRYQLSLLVACAVGLTAVSCDKPADNKKGASRPDAAPRQVKTVRAELLPMERALPVVGTLSAYEEVTLAAQVAGQMEKFPADLGDRAPAGQELALIDTTSYEALAQLAAANLAKAVAAATNAARNLNRVRDLQRDQISSASEFDKAMADADSAAAEVKAAAASEAIARLNLDRSRVKAPFDGAVAQRLSSVGGYVAIGAPILKFVKTDPLRLRLDVPERASSGVKVGQIVRVTVEGDTNVYSGKLARVAPALRDSDRMLAVEADVPAQGSLRPGMFAKANIVVNEREAVISIPTNALTVFAGLEKVVTVKDAKASERVVTTGRQNSNYVEVVSGLRAGETVVLDPAGIRTGQPLTIESSGRNTSAVGNQSTNGQ